MSMNMHISANIYYSLYIIKHMYTLRINNGNNDTPIVTDVLRKLNFLDAFIPSQVLIRYG